MKAWQFATHGPISKTLRLATDVPRPDAASLQPGQILVKVASAGLNPVDYKMPELGLAARAMFSFPKIPCGDLSGTAVAVGEGVEGLKAGDHVSIQPYVKAGDRVFINGGSGGTGTHGIQIAKLLGCHVTVSCSTAKVEFCRGLGADEVIDYKIEDVVASLVKQSGSAGAEKWDLIVDNIGNSPTDLYKRSHEVLRDGGVYAYVGGRVSAGSMWNIVRGRLLPGFLGGQRRRFVLVMAQQSTEYVRPIVDWMADGKLKTVVDSKFEFGQVKEAYERLKTDRCQGKVIVKVVGREE
ncbi:alcohol dehydrogenase zinc-binding domain-containing protein [Verticillium alfalfae VaMs.102]|uniref:Alcohol dehydrogenase zinc-binding domain-containing protein n=1 Tax=Verticillium alfalfae (strain VaMs.102 / ATCC MYA-4576 / FGSC 10136) TaxID=526221 RepID=C9SGC7_VERA1|nr:alcohol dehydrogenase zinc-binding domain-containing protein [Verticillium alfalfae VaMs.102]EEY17467.1 alcohol dehydrogenase zinc-binding domain-containing protein [Verticillium alfalfae VaMs.102]